jgi:HAD superfamily hydrolase (TIGR01509 family)
MTIKLVAFDLDGVLANSRELHYKALNDALAEIDPKYVISRAEHLATYDARPTSVKLQLLTEHKGLPVELHQRVWELKQQKTENAIFTLLRADFPKMRLFRKLKERGIRIAVCSNSTRDNVRNILIVSQLWNDVDFYFSNEDVFHHKPHGEIYQRAMLAAKVNAHETLIVEDSHVGREAAINSGGHLCAVRNEDDVTEERIFGYIDAVNSYANAKPAWLGGKMNVLVPMAGHGSRFQAAGYTFPKPLIEVEGKPMIQLVTENLNIQARFIYIVQKDHYEKYNLHQLLRLISPGCEVIQVESVTEGAACTTLLAKDLINSDEPLVIANSDQYILWDSNEFMHAMTSDDIDAGILTFKATHPKWSFVRLDEHGFVAEVAEKNPISDIATVGVYYWTKGSDYVKYAEQMIAKDIRVNGEFYVCPVFNEAIADGKKIKTFPVRHMWGIGTPEDLQKFNERGCL